MPNNNTDNSELRVFLTELNSQPKIKEYSLNFTNMSLKKQNFGFRFSNDLPLNNIVTVYIH